MASKSFVTLEQQVCVVCGTTFDTGTLLLDKRLRERFEMHTVTGWGMCEEHQKLYDKGYIALVGCDPKKTEVSREGTVKQEGAHRTGVLMHVRFSVFEQIFDRPLPMKEGKPLPMMFVEQGVIDQLQQNMDG